MAKELKITYATVLHIYKEDGKWEVTEIKNYSDGVANSVCTDTGELFDIVIWDTGFAEEVAKKVISDLEEHGEGYVYYYVEFTVEYFVSRSSEGDEPDLDYEIQEEEVDWLGKDWLKKQEGERED